MGGERLEQECASECPCAQRDRVGVSLLEPLTSNRASLTERLTWRTCRLSCPRIQVPLGWASRATAFLKPSLRCSPFVIASALRHVLGKDALVV
ncbi:hypothetical protein E2C01_095811 [Portunus trituberculatus]|uniref:Uncharacterized protein n=1 Tax=Portunus trituberculatus TaxID=210409 RepID=A0A5B7K151_PORTR|nr:hypothetical protein [Portunus trituberculatus]